jgi:hypothetical protein
MIRRLTWDELLECEDWAIIASGTDADLEAFAKWQNPNHVATRVVRGDRCATRDALFDEWAAALQFPLDSPSSWNAFDDDMGDLSWMKSGSVIIFVARADTLLEAVEADYDVQVVLEILRKAVTEPLLEGGNTEPEHPRRLRFVFHGRDTAVIRAHTRLHGVPETAWLV